MRYKVGIYNEDGEPLGIETVDDEDEREWMYDEYDEPDEYDEEEDESEQE